MATGYNHGEAFMWMYYSNEDGTVGYWIYNTRDGVTPMSCSIKGVDLMHRFWKNDLHQPNYKPKEDDLIFRTMTADEAEQLVHNLYEANENNKEFLKHPPFKNKEKVIAERRADAEKMKHPVLAIVDSKGNYVLYNLYD